MSRRKLNAPETPKPFVPSEDHECAGFVRWLEAQIAARAPILFSHIPNETPTSTVQAARLKRLGVRRGVPDYMLIIGTRLVFIEMKRTDGGRVSAHQNAWIAALSMTGASAHVCSGAREAIALVSKMLAQGD